MALLLGYSLACASDDHKFKKAVTNAEVALASMKERGENVREIASARINPSTGRNRVGIH
jgi:hypothetical protein